MIKLTFSLNKWSAKSTTHTDVGTAQTGNAKRSRGKRVVSGLTALMVLVSSVIAFMPAQRASAWSGDLPRCNYGDALNWAWKDKILSKPIPDGWKKLDVDNYGGAVTIVGFDNNPTSNMSLSLYFADAAQFTQSATGARSLVMTGNVRLIGITKDPTNPSFKNDVAGPNQPGDSTLTSIACITMVSNPSYATSYTGAQYAKETPGQVKTCSGATDVGCHIKNAFSFVGDSFKAVGEAMVNGIAFLFMPDQAEMNKTITDFQTFMSEKLGFLLYPFTFVVEFSDAMKATSNWCNETSCSRNFGTMFGQPLQFDFLGLKKLNGQLWTMATVGIQGLTVFGLIEALRRKYMGVVSK